MKKLEDVFVSAAARENARWSEICLDGSERRMLKVKRAESGSAMVLAQPSRELTDKAAKALDALPEPVEVEIIGLDGSVAPGWAFFRFLRRLGQEAAEPAATKFYWKVTPKGFRSRAQERTRGGSNAHPHVERYITNAVIRRLNKQSSKRPA